MQQPPSFPLCQDGDSVCFLLVSCHGSLEWLGSQACVFCMCVCVPCHSSPVRLCATPGIGAGEAPLSMGFSRQEYLSGLPCSPPGDLLNPGIESTPLMYPTLADGFFTSSPSWEALCLLPMVNSSPCHRHRFSVYIYINCWGIVAHPYRVFGWVAPSKACSRDLLI